LQTTIHQKSPPKIPILAIAWEKLLPSWWRQDWLLGLVLVAVTLMAYQPVWHAGFIWDDDSFLTNNPVIKSADGLYRMWFTASTPDYYPVTSSMLWLEWRVWANHPLGYHLVNVLLHGFSSVLLWRVLLRLNLPGALLAAAFFALHPVNVESVAWITERKNTLCMFFYLGTLLAWLRFEDSGKWRWHALALAGFALALLSKTAVAPLPVVLLGMAWWRRGRVGWKDIRQVVPFFVMAAGLGLVTVWFQQNASGHDPFRTDGFWSRLAVAGWAVWFYLYKAVLPLKLAFVYPRWQIDVGNVLTYIPLVMLAAAFVLCWRCRKGWGRALFFGLAYFVLMLLPVLGFLNIYFMRFSLVADHWQYFAIIGPITLAGAMIRRPLVAAALVLALGALTWKQCGMYANPEVLWQTTFRLNPNCWLGQDELGYKFLQQGRLDEAIAHYAKAVELKPDYVEANTHLGNCLFQKGRLDEAITHYQKALQIKPDYAPAHNSLGNALMREGKVDEAITHYRKALQLDPVNPSFQSNLAWLLATSPRASLRNGNIAVELARRANELTGGTNPLILRALAAAFAEAGRFPEAVETAQRGWQLAQAQSNTKVAGQLQSDIKLYEAGSPYHLPAQPH
jgi:Flp pilus assembly protein TadD